MNDSSDRADVRPPSIGRFIALEAAGVDDGAPITVWDPELDRRAVLHWIGPVDGDGFDAGRHSVARRLASVRNDHVARVLEVGEHSGIRFVAVEATRGRTLAEWCSAPDDARGHATQPVALVIAAAHGLAAIHRAGVAHGAIEPAALKLDDTGRIRLTGFAFTESVDLARALSDDCSDLCRALVTSFEAATARGDVGIPPWLIDALRAGAQRGASRWRDASELLRDLETRRHRPRRIALLGCSAAVALSLGYAVTRPADDPCAAAIAEFPPPARVAEVTEPDRRTRHGIHARLDAYWERWRAEFDAICGDLRARDALPEPAKLRDASNGAIACLDEAREALATMSDELASGELSEEAASTVVFALPDLRACRDRRATGQGREIHSRALRLARAAALADLGQAGRAAALLDELDAEGWDELDGLRSRADLVRANVEHMRDDRSAAYQAALRSVLAAQRADEWRAEASGWAVLAATASRLDRVAEAELAATRAESIGAASDHWAAASDAKRVRADIAMRAGSFDDAVARYLEAEALIIEHDLDDPLRLARVYSEVAAPLSYTNRIDEAIAYARRASELLTAAIGGDNALALHALAVLGWTLADAGRVEEAIDVLTRADRGLAGDPHASRDDHGIVVTRLVEQLAAARRHDEAIARADAALGANLEPTMRRFVETARAGALLDGGRPREAAEAYRALHATEPAGSLNSAAIAANLAVALARIGRVDEATELVGPAIAIYRRHQLPERRVARLVATLSEVSRLAGRTDQAIAACNEAIAMLERAAPDGAELARARLERAKALAMTGDLDRAREDASAASRGFAQHGDMQGVAEAQAVLQ